VVTAEAFPPASALPRGPLTLPPGKRISLSFLSGPREGTEHTLRHASLLIGREGGNSGAAIELAETQVSRMHAMVEVRGDRYVLRDLESKNGTFIGSERVKEVEIHHGTEFQIGGTRFMLLVADT
jgi:pSer/pThr/pTyr-binding forkhead associated (FHA) protein